MSSGFVWFGWEDCGCLLAVEPTNRRVLNRFARLLAKVEALHAEEFASVEQLNDRQLSEELMNTLVRSTF